MISNDPIKVENKNWRDLVPLTDKHLDACRDEALLFPQVNGVVEDEKYVSMVNCACCSSQESRQIFVKWGFIYNECQACTHIYIKNQLRPEILLKLYGKSIADDLILERNSNAHLKSYSLKIYSKYLEGLLNSADQEVENLLDVGCGLGTFLDFAKQKTHINLFGSEFSEAAFDKLNKLLGDNLFFKMELDEIDQKTNEKFDLITFWGVLEHVTDPLRNLMSACNTPCLNPRRHIQYFSKASMEKCVERASLEIENRFQELPVIDLMYPHIQFSESLVSDIMDRREAYYDIYIIRHA